MNSQMLSINRAAGLILVLSNVVLLPGLLMFCARQGQKGGEPRTPAHYAWERAFVAAWVILTAVGFALLRETLGDGPGQALAVTGATAYFFGSVLPAAGEVLSPTAGYGKLYRLAAC